jgi:hypothetical protein
MVDKTKNGKEAKNNKINQPPKGGKIDKKGGPASSSAAAKLLTTTKHVEKGSQYRHMGDNLYKVDIAAIIVETIVPDESDTLKFANPRKIDASEEYASAGFSHEDMDSLKESIRSRGLLTPLIGRFKESADENGDKISCVSVINGHRRLQAIKELVESNTPCYDPITKETVNSASLYKEISFKVFDVADEIECYLLSFEEDKTKVKFGPGTETRFVQHCRSRFIPDSQIMRMTGNSQEWLSDTYNLLDNLADDSHVIHAFFSGAIDRGLAKHLATIADKEIRHKLMNGAIENASDRHSIRQDRIETTINAKMDKIEVLSAAKICDEYAGNQEDADEKQSKIEKLEGDIKDVKRKNGGGPRAGKADLKKAARKADLAEEVDLPTASRISVKWPEFFKNVISNGGALIQDESTIIPDVLLRYSAALLKSVDNPKGNPEEFLTTWVKKFKESGLKDD